MNNGWVKLHRSMLDWEWYTDINVCRLFTHMLLKANHKDKNWRGILIKRGQTLTSLNTLESETGLSKSQIRTAIKKLNSTQEIAQQSHSQYTVFTIKNYDSYQVDDTQNDKPVTHESHTDDTPMTSNKNDKNDKNEDKSIVEAKPQRGEFKFNDDQYRFAEEMFKRISKVAPNSKKPNLESWSNEIRKLNENDKVNLNFAWKVFCWANADSFWGTNILSAKKFRGQFAQLSAKMENKPAQAQQQEHRRPSRKEIKL